MSWSPLTLARMVGRSHRSRRPLDDQRPVGVLSDELRRRNAAMAGLDVPPVHGHHCICGRCERQARAAS